MSNGKKAEVKEPNLPAIIERFNFLAISNFDELKENLGNRPIGPGDLERVSVPAGKGTKWEVIGADGEPESLADLTGICVYFKDVRSFWKDEYTGKGGPPDCKSLDTITGIGIPGGSCHTCPKASFGSGKNDSQACKAQRLLYLMREGQLLPLVVTIPPTSLGPMAKWFISLLSRNMVYNRVVMSLKIEKVNNKGGIEYSKVKPSIVSKLDEDTAAKVKAYAKGLQSVMEGAAAINPTNDSY
jgi:hypothetical protein